jgi:pyruvate dehydrogenase E2 component (dihydrolipoamide acetyltransferase)
VAQQEVRIPDIGDAQDVEVIEILAEVGKHIGLDDPLVVIESDKASMEVPSTASGTLREIKVAIGDKVREGQVVAIVEIDSVAAAQPKLDSTVTAAALELHVPGAMPVTEQPTTVSRRLDVRIPDIGDAKDVVVVEVAVKPGQLVAVDDLLVVVESDKASMEIPAPVAGRIASVEVSEGGAVAEGSLLVVIETTAPAGATTTASSATATPLPQEPSGVVAVAPPRAAAVEMPAPADSGAPPSGSVYAGPAVRRLARELGVDLAKVSGSGAHQRILKEDVDAFVKAALTAPRAGQGGMVPPVPVIDFARFGAIEIVDLTRIRARGAENLHRSWLNIPHVTQHDEADITDLEEFRDELKPEASAKGIKLTPLAFVVKAVVTTLKAFPTFNASLDPTVKQLILKRYIHIGLAVDTPEGLVVPVLRDADRKGVFDLAAEMDALSKKAQQGKLSMADLQGASFTVTSLGAIGGTGFTPIINAPEVAILGVSRLTMKPHWNGSAFEPRKMLPVSLSYDHRAINGAEAGRFVTALCQTLADMRRILL